MALPWPELWAALRGAEEPPERRRRRAHEARPVPSPGILHPSLSHTLLFSRSTVTTGNALVRLWVYLFPVCQPHGPRGPPLDVGDFDFSRS